MGFTHSRVTRSSRGSISTNKQTIRKNTSVKDWNIQDRRRWQIIEQEKIARPTHFFSKYHLKKT